MVVWKRAWRRGLSAVEAQAKHLLTYRTALAQSSHPAIPEAGIRRLPSFSHASTQRLQRHPARVTYVQSRPTP